METDSLFDAMLADGVSARDVAWVRSIWETSLTARGVTLETLSAHSCRPSQLAEILRHSVPLHAVFELLGSSLATADEVVALCQAEVPLYDALVLLERGVPLTTVLSVAQAASRPVDFPLLAYWHEFGFTAEEVLECVSFKVPLEVDDLGELAVALPFAAPSVRAAAVVLLHGGMDVDQAVLVARQCDGRPWRQTLLTFVADGMTARDALAAAQAIDVPRRVTPPRPSPQMRVSP